jgi:hypothetical protein
MPTSWKLAKLALRSLGLGNAARFRETELREPESAVSGSLRAALSFDPWAGGRCGALARAGGRRERRAACG